MRRWCRFEPAGLLKARGEIASYEIELLKLDKELASSGESAVALGGKVHEHRCGA